MNCASPAARGAMPAPNALRLVEFINLHHLAAQRAVAAAAAWHDFRRRICITHGGNLISRCGAAKPSPRNGPIPRAYGRLLVTSVAPP